MPSRADNIFARYARAVSAQENIERALQQFAADEERANALEVLAANERANLAALEESFAVPPTDSGSAQLALQERYQEERAAIAAGRAARASRNLTASQRAQLEQPSKAQSYAALLALAGDSSVTREQLDQAQQVYTTRHGQLSQQEGNTLAQAADLPDRARALPGRPGELTQAQRGTEQALQALYFAGPQGVFGGFDGEQEVNARRARQAPQGSKFTTGQDAFDVYLRLLEDGEVTAQDLADELGYESAEAAQSDLAFAKAQYDNARAVGAFTNNQRKYFEGRWLDAAKQYSDIQSRAEQMRQRVPVDPTQAAIRQELQRRGVNVDDPFLRYQGTPLHGILTEAERLYQSGQVSAEGNKDLLKVEELLRQHQKTGTRWNVNALEEQLRKTLGGDDLSGALSYALAYQRQLDEGAPGADTNIPLGERRVPETPTEEAAPLDEDAFLMARQALADAQRAQREIEQELEQQAPPTPAPTPAPAPPPQTQAAPLVLPTLDITGTPPPAPPAQATTAQTQQAMSPMMQALNLPAVQAPQPAPAAPAPAPAPDTQAQRTALQQQLIDALDAGDIATVASLQQQLQALGQ